MSAAESLAVAVAVTNLWESPDGTHDVDAPMLVDRPDPAAWPAALDVSARRKLTNRVLTQLLLGEAVHILEEAGDWVRVVAPWQPSDRDPRGYPGWVRRAHLGIAPLATEHEAVVTVDATILAGGAGEGVGPATYATVLPVADWTGNRDDDVLVHLPDGGMAGVAGRACLVRDTPFGRDPAMVDPDEVVAEARRFSGLPYLWGGMSAYGLDCSGLVHITYRRLGAIVPRDAHDQAAASEHLPRDQARRGDLLFYARPGKSIHHVGFALDDPTRVLHAPGTGASIVDEPMNDDRRATILDFAGRLSGWR